MVFIAQTTNNRRTIDSQNGAKVVIWWGLPTKILVSMMHVAINPHNYNNVMYTMFTDENFMGPFWAMVELSPLPSPSPPDCRLDTKYTKFVLLQNFHHIREFVNSLPITV